MNKKDKNVDWENYSNIQLIHAASGKKDGLERTDLYALIEELGVRLDELADFDTT